MFEIILETNICSCTMSIVHMFDSISLSHAKAIKGDVSYTAFQGVIMGTIFRTFGNLAIKSYDPGDSINLEVISNSHTNKGVFFEILDQVFGSHESSASSSRVEAVLDNLEGILVFSTAREKRVATLISAIGLFALFYFSFFAF